MSYTYSPASNFAQPGGYGYHSREVTSQDEFYNEPRYPNNRHTPHDFGHYQGNELFSTSYEAQSDQHNSRHYGQPYFGPTVPAFYNEPDRQSFHSSSPTSTSDMTRNRHASSASASSMETPTTPSYAFSDKPYCTHEDCLDHRGQPTKTFSRKADLQRHVRSTHDSPSLDCPWKKCPRKGGNGFTRQDHLTEHRRQYHCEDIAKRVFSGARKEVKGRHAA